MKLLVTGATGFVGREILRQLRPLSHTVRILARDPRSPSARELAAECGAKTVAGDVSRPDSLAAAMAGVEGVIHLVGIISEVGERTFENVHARGTANVVGAAAAVGVRRFVHMSALGARPNAVSRYHQTKWAAEETVRGSGLDWTIFRPSLIYGPEDHFVNLFAALSRWSPVLPVMGRGRNLLQPISVEAVAQCFVGALTEPRSIGETYDLCGDERLTFVEVLDLILARAGRKRWKLHVPMALARLQAAFLECVFPSLFGQAPPLNRDQLLMLAEDNVGHPKPAQALFNLPPESFPEGVSR